MRRRAVATFQLRTRSGWSRLELEVETSRATKALANNNGSFGGGVAQLMVVGAFTGLGLLTVIVGASLHASGSATPTVTQSADGHADTPRTAPRKHEPSRWALGPKTIMERVASAGSFLDGVGGRPGSTGCAERRVVPKNFTA